MKDLIKLIKTELKYLGYLFLALLVIFKIVFYKENTLILIRTIVALFWLFILPGFTLMYIWKEKFDFLERLISGFVLGIALVGLTSYYLTLSKLNIGWQYILVPLIFLAISIGYLLKSHKPSDEKKTVNEAEERSQ